MNDAWDDEEGEEEEVIHRSARRRRAARNDQRGNLYLLTGLVIGITLGLVYAWLISPVRYVDTEPTSLAAPYKDEYRRVIALAYAANHDLGRARERLSLLGSGNPVQELAAQAQRMLAGNQPPQEARALALLASDLGRSPGSVAMAASLTPPSTSTNPVGSASGTPSPQTAATGVSSETPGAAAIVETSGTPDISAAIQTPTLPPPTRTPTITLTPLPSFTPRPTSTPMPVLDAPFTLKNKREVCNGSIQPGLLQIEITDADGKPLPGVQVVVSWKDGEDVFYTGLAPEIDPGYADFVMADKTSYNVKVGEVSDPVNGLTIPTCGGGWKVEFQEKAPAH